MTYDSQIGVTEEEAIVKYNKKKNAMDSGFLPKAEQPVKKFIKSSNSSKFAKVKSLNGQVSSSANCISSIFSLPVLSLNSDTTNKPKTTTTSADGNHLQKCNMIFDTLNSITSCASFDKQCKTTYDCLEDSSTHPLAHGCPAMASVTVLQADSTHIQHTQNSSKIPSMRTATARTTPSTTSTETAMTAATSPTNRISLSSFWTVFVLISTLLMLLEHAQSGKHWKLN